MSYRPPGPFEGTQGACDSCSRVLAASRAIEIRLGVPGRQRTHWQFCTAGCRDEFLHRAGTHSHGGR